MLPYYIAERINLPVFIVESEYDEWQLQNSQLMACVHGRSLAGCSQEQLDKINKFRGALVSEIEEVLSTPHAQEYKWGAWSPACVKHGFTDANSIYNSSDFQVPMSSGNTVQAAIQQWTNSLNLQGSNERIIYIDNVTWPDNKPCSGLKSIYDFEPEEELQ